MSSAGQNHDDMHDLGLNGRELVPVAASAQLRPQGTPMLPVFGSSWRALASSSASRSPANTIHGLLALLKKPRYDRATCLYLLQLLNDLLTR